MTDTSTTEVADSLDFGIEYDGPVLVNHEMDVRDLAPALLSVGNLFQTLNRRIHPADPEISVNIRANEEGSFLVQLKLIYDHAANVLGNRGLVEGEGLTGLIAGLVALIAYLRKRGQAGRPEETRHEATVRLTWPDGTVLEMPTNVFLLADDPAVRVPLAEVVKPVSREGIDSLRLVRDGVVLGEVDTDNLPAFQADSVVEGHILRPRNVTPICAFLRAHGKLAGSGDLRMAVGHSGHESLMTRSTLHWQQGSATGLTTCCTVWSVRFSGKTTPGCTLKSRSFA